MGRVQRSNSAWNLKGGSHHGRQPLIATLPCPAAPCVLPLCCLGLYWGPGSEAAAESRARLLVLAGNVACRRRHCRLLPARRHAAHPAPARPARSLPCACSPLHDAAQAGNAGLLRELLTPPPEAAQPASEELAGLVRRRRCCRCCSPSAAAVSVQLGCPRPCMPCAGSLRC
jgi:hypothetical protein